ncbi:MAG: Uncharacterized protein G01um101438_275 [Parcubacteria group bacterium Gr01-1014_38]|nr:MAG: Uncharacterized protein G01um101438_275 [Parcubacteria group bacterium Gr01-1014_38]
MSKTLITSGKRKQIVRLLKDGLDKVALDDSGAQRLIERGDELQEGLKELLERLSVTDQVADEEVESSYGCPSGYKFHPTLEENLADLERELKMIRRMFPELANADIDRSVLERIKAQDLTLPTGAERWTLIPRWEKIASTYNEAVEKVIELIAASRKFINYRAGKLGPDHLRQHTRKVDMFQTLGEQQKGHDILVVPAQFGLRHRGRSIRRAHEVFVANECGLGAFAVGCMLLTHPERLQHYDDLWIDCAVDEYAPVAVGGFPGAPSFLFCGGWLRLGACWFDGAYGNYGSASGFLPQ